MAVRYNSRVSSIRRNAITSASSVERGQVEVRQQRIDPPEFEPRRDEKSGATLSSPVRATVSTTRTEVYRLPAHARRLRCAPTLRHLPDNARRAVDGPRRSPCSAAGTCRDRHRASPSLHRAGPTARSEMESRVGRRRRAGCCCVDRLVPSRIAGGTSMYAAADLRPPSGAVERRRQRPSPSDSRSPTAPSRSPTRQASRRAREGLPKAFVVEPLDEQHLYLAAGRTSQPERAGRHVCR